ncbi:MAG: hypothetical protein RSC10_07695 [Longicatena sp.]
MEANGRKILKVSAVLELSFGLAAFGLIYFALQQGDAKTFSTLGLNGNNNSFITLSLAYGQAGIQTIAGIVGIVFCGNTKYYKLCMLFGLLLVLSVVLNFLTIDFSLSSLGQLAISLIVPLFYYYGAGKNKPSLQ